MDLLATVRELVEVLEQLDRLTQRKGELIAALAGEDWSKDKLGWVNPQSLVHAPKPPKPRRKTIETVVEPTTETDIFPLTEQDKARIEAKVSERNLSGRTPEEQAKLEADAMADYEANVDPATDSQKRMIFGILGREFGIRDDAEMKDLIIAIVAKLHHGEKIQSISKELSKAWAGDVIDWLTKANQKDIEALRVPF